MLLKEMKLRTLSLIEEVNPESELLTDDIDIQAKINYVIDMKQNELARIKKIAAIETVEVKENEEVDLYKDLNNFYRLNSVKGVEYELFENIITFKEEGTATIKYYKYPKMITADTKDDEYKFELSTDVLEIMPLGIAADLLKSDVSAQYGRVYADAYDKALNMLDIRITEGSFEIKGGLNV
jgi:hypothetical protein